jgi:hypothetical protein
MALPLGLTNTTAYIKLGNDNYSATVPPSVTDDYNSNYEEGSIWQDTVTSTLYICTDGTVGAAVWEVLPTGVSQNFATSDLTVDANRTHDMAGFDMKLDLFSSTGQFILSSGQGGYGNFNFIPYSTSSSGVARIDNGLSYIQFRVNYGAEVNKLSINKNLTASAPALGVQGTGSTSATTTALFENSSSTELMRIYDDGKFHLASPITTVLYSDGTRGSMGMGQTRRGDSHFTIKNSSSSSYGLSLERSDGTLYAQFGNITTLTHVSGSDYHLFQGGAICKFEQYNNGSNIMAFRSNGTSFMSGYFKIGGTTRDASSALDIESTTQGFLVPRMTTVQKNAISTPATSLLVFDTDNNQHEYYDGATWSSFGGADTNFASSDLTFAADRTHDLAGFNVTLDDAANTSKFSMTVPNIGSGNREIFTIQDRVANSGYFFSKGGTQFEFTIRTAGTNKIKLNGNGNGSLAVGTSVSLGGGSSDQAYLLNDHLTLGGTNSSFNGRFGVRGLSMFTGTTSGAFSETALATVHVRGIGSTSATTALLVENSSGTDLLKLDDDGTFELKNGSQTNFFAQGSTNRLSMGMGSTFYC